MGRRVGYYAPSSRVYDTDGDTLGAAQDLLTDLMHLTEREEGDFVEILRLAEMHFTAEVNGEL